MDSNLGIVTIELSNGSTFKFGYTRETLIKNLVADCAEKTRLKHSRYFGLMPYLEDQACWTLVPQIKDTERVFLNDSSTVDSQITSGEKLYFAVKYPDFFDGDTVVEEDELMLSIISEDIISRYLKCGARFKLPIEKLSEIASIIFQIRILQNAIIKLSNDCIKSICPVEEIALKGRESDFIKAIQCALPTFKNKQLSELINALLLVLRNTVPALFQTFFLAVNQESMTPFWVGATMSGLNIYNSELEHLSYYSYNSISEYHTSLAIKKKSSLDVVEKSFDTMSILETKKKSSWRKRFSRDYNKTQFFNVPIEAMTAMETFPKAIIHLAIKTDHSTFNLHFALLSNYCNPDRIEDYLRRCCSTEKTAQIQLMSTKSITAENAQMFTIFLANGEQMSFLLNKDVLTEDLRLKICLKMNLIESDLFGLYDCSFTPIRLLENSITMRDNGISSSSRVMFQIRMMYKLATEISDLNAIHLYFLQVTQLVLKSHFALTELDAVDLAAYHMRSVYGSTELNFSKIQAVMMNYIPQNQVKNFKSDFLKSVLARYIQFKDISRSDCEICYLKIVETKPGFGHVIFKSLDHEIYDVGISRSGIFLVQKQSGEIAEFFDIGTSLLSWTNNSFQMELNLADGRIFRIFSFFTLQIIDSLEFLNNAKLMASLKKLCKDIRSKLALFGIEPVATKVPEPEQTFIFLNSDSQTRTLLGCLFKDKRDLWHGDLTDLFFGLVKSELGFSDADIPKKFEMTQFNLRNAEKVFNFYLRVLIHPVSQVAIHNSDFEAERRRSASISMAQMQACVIKEAVETESMYVKDLEKLTYEYFYPIKIQQLLPIKDVECIFGNIEMLLDFHQKFYSRLLLIKDSLVEICEHFILHAGELQTLYISYCSSQGTSSDLLVSLRDQTFLAGKYGESDPLWFTNWCSLMMKPVQRILKYHLLFKEIFKNTEADCSQIVQIALDRMREVALMINEVKRQNDTQLAFKDVLSRVCDVDVSTMNLLQNLPIPVFHDSVNISENTPKKAGPAESIQLFLFENVLIFVKETSSKGKGQLKMKSLLDLAKIQGADLKDTRDAVIIDRGKDKKLLLSFRSKEPCERFFPSLQNCIQNASKLRDDSVLDEKTSQDGISERSDGQSSFDKISELESKNAELLTALSHERKEKQKMLDFFLKRLELLGRVSDQRSMVDEIAKELCEFLKNQ